LFLQLEALLVPLVKGQLLYVLFGQVYGQHLLALLDEHGRLLLNGGIQVLEIRGMLDKRLFQRLVQGPFLRRK